MDTFIHDPRKCEASCSMSEDRFVGKKLNAVMCPQRFAFESK